MRFPAFDPATWWHSWSTDAKRDAMYLFFETLMCFHAGIRSANSCEDRPLLARASFLFCRKLAIWLVPLKFRTSYHVHILTSDFQLGFGLVIQVCGIEDSLRSQWFEVAILQPKKNHWRSSNADLMPGVLEEDQDWSLFFCVCLIRRFPIEKVAIRPLHEVVYCTRIMYTAYLPSIYSLDVFQCFHRKLRWRFAGTPLCSLPCWAKLGGRSMYWVWRGKRDVGIGHTYLSRIHFNVLLLCEWSSVLAGTERTQSYLARTLVNELICQADEYHQCGCIWLHVFG